MKNTLTFKTSRHRRLHIQYFERNTKGSGSTPSYSVSMTDTPQAIYKKVLDLENEERKKYNDHGFRDVVFCYWVIEYEEMTDDRSEFGHSNQSSTKEVAVIVPNTYVRGEVMTVGQALAKVLTDDFSNYVKATLSNFISLDLKFDEKKLSNKQLVQKIVMIPGEGSRETFFDHHLKTTQIKIFPEKKLIPILEKISA